MGSPAWLQLRAPEGCHPPWRPLTSTRRVPRCPHRSLSVTEPFLSCFLGRLAFWIPVAELLGVQFGTKTYNRPFDDLDECGRGPHVAIHTIRQSQKRGAHESTSLVTGRGTRSQSKQQTVDLADKVYGPDRHQAYEQGGRDAEGQLKDASVRGHRRLSLRAPPHEKLPLLQHGDVVQKNLGFADES